MGVESGLPGISGRIGSGQIGFGDVDLRILFVFSGPAFRCCQHRSLAGSSAARALEHAKREPEGAGPAHPHQPDEGSRSLGPVSRDSVGVTLRRMNPSTPSAKPWEHAKQGEGSASDPLAARFVESLSYDRRMYEYDILGSIAHARMLASVGLISDDDLKAIERGLKQIGDQIRDDFDGWPGWRLELEDVHMCIEAALIDAVGEPGRKLHTGRSRNDQVALDLHLWCQDASWILSESLAGLCGAFLELAERAGQTVMPSYTHLQRAQPIVVGAELLCWEQAFAHCRTRLANLGFSFATMPLGGGAIAGSSLPIDRQVVMSRLSELRLPRSGRPPRFASLSSNSLFATAGRDAALDMIYGLSMTAMWLSRWAEQWIIYLSTEFGFVKIDDRYTTGSSMMPQKRNPDMLELIRGRAGNVYGHLTAMLTICKGITVGYNRDLQEDKRHLFAAFDVVSDCIEMARRIVATAGFDAQAIQAGLERGFLDATSLADYLVTRKVPFRTAHQVVGQLVRLCEQRVLHRLGDLALEDFNQVCVGMNLGEGVCEPAVYDWLGTAKVVERYRSQGNAGVNGLAEQLKERWRYWSEEGAE